ncbi:MAG: 4-(cytidine 5'-diphospho)-2-C-methyl-D-erythritol kinase [Serpentinimonas sp.]|nr:4-(cytidine 5'-diphospho)-2-C-methyl-D-erythritol kinase [Serpentinimonas sp.]
MSTPAPAQHTVPAPSAGPRELLDVPAPAKLNLFLHVVGRRPDGYHLLQSVFVLLDWADVLHFERRAGGRVDRSDVHPGAQALPADDLCVRAARALQQATGCTEGVHITLDKRLPAQAGLGGGSSDAATCLLALNRLWRLGLSPAELQRIGVTLGADVPFFLGGQNAWVEGIGEQITPLVLPDWPARFLVAKPPEGVSTPQIFGHPTLKRDTKRSIIEDFVASTGSQPDPKHGNGWTTPLYGHNDLQAPAEMLCPDINWGLERFRQMGLAGRMSGSGSAIFSPLGRAGGIDPTVESEHQALLAGWPSGWVVRVCNRLDRHPLLGW